MTDYYKILGVERTATADEIKQAYRRLAARHHPDRGGDTAQFQQIEEAHRVLSDPAQRAGYDRPQTQYHEFNFSHGGGHFNFDEIFNMFGARFNQRQSQIRLQLWITLADVVQGGRRAVAIDTGQGRNTVEIMIPVGINDGESVQYSGIAPNGGDLIVTFRVRPDEIWQRHDNNLLRDAVISIWTLIQGGATEVVTLNNQRLTVQIPAGTQPGTILRIRGHGLPAKNGAVGDIMVRIQAQIPETISAELKAAIQKEIT